MIACLVFRSDTAGPDISVPITLSTSASNSAAGYTAVTRPHSYAVEAGIRSAVSAIRMARMRPTAAAINADAPPSGINPILVNASMKNAFSEANTTSDANASDAPTPAHGPCTTATTGCGRLTIDRTASLAASRTDAGPSTDFFDWSSSLIPAPEENPRPAPPSRTTLTRGSVAACSKLEVMVLNIAAVSEFRLSGRFIVTDSTPSASSTVRSSIPV